MTGVQTCALPIYTFDLIVLSEVGFYWSREDLAVAHTKIIRHLRPQGHLILVHWTVPCEEHPLSADEVHALFLYTSRAQLEHLMHLDVQVAPHSYRLDLFRRV